MIKVTIYKTEWQEYAGFDMEGHAGYAEAGEDIVCAGVSALVINALNSIERFTDDETSCVSDEGHNGKQGFNLLSQEEIFTFESFNFCHQNRFQYS